MTRGVKLAIWLVALAVLASVGQILSGSFSTRCAMDGRRIEPFCAVVAHLPDHQQKVFCSVRCAVSFLASADLRSVDGGAIEVDVRDEITGESLSPERAHFVRGRADGSPPYDGVHVFADWAKALAQQEVLGGELIANPFKR
jgi:hypothetical protein